MVVTDVQPLNTLQFTNSIEAGKSILVSDSQAAKAYSPIFTLSGNVMLLRDLQAWNARFPIYVTESGITIFSRDLQ